MQKRGKPLFSGSSLLLLFLVFASSLYWFTHRENTVKELTYGELMQILQGSDPGLRLQDVRVRKSLVRGEIVTSDTVSDGAESKIAKDTIPFRTPIGLASDPDLLRLLRERAGGSFQGEEEESLVSGLLSLLMSFMVIFLVVIAGFYLFRWIAGGSSPLSFGRSRHRLYAEDDVKITFEDVAGIDEAVAELREIVDFLKNPDKYQVLGGRIPKGVLLVGPPGTGKTLLARAVAGEADVPFFSVSGSDFVEMFVGVGASRVRDVFRQAESRAPCIIFIDELDALGKTRGVSAIGGHDEREQTLNQLLVEMDGFDSNRGVIIVGATNRPETLDPALLRPGRFDRTVVVDRPDLVGREAILKVHVRHVKLAEDVDLRKVASLTPGSVGADLANIVNEAALIAARKNGAAVNMPAFDEAIERGQAGLERKSRIMHAEEKQRVAYHEAGHALVACALPNTDPVHKVSIIPRGLALGYVLRRPEDDRYLTTQSELESHIKCALGGTIAEELIFGEISSGATSDLEKANQIAHRMVKDFGMSRLGRVSYRDSGNPFFLGGPGVGESERYSEETAREIDVEVRRILDEATQEVRQILRTRRIALEALAQRLVEKEVVSSDELRQLIDEHHPGPKLVPGSLARSAGSDADEDADEPALPQTRESTGLP